MRDQSRPRHIPAAVSAAFSSPRFSATLTHLILGLAFATHLVRSLMGWPGLLGALICLVLLAAASMIARRHSIEWHGLLPVSILVFLVWCALSVLWSEYPLRTLSGVGYQLAFAFLAIYVALVRDTIQIVRATGDVLRVLLGLSIALEVLSGLLLDLPITFLGVQGNIALLGPIQGIFGSRNVLGLVSLIAAISFIIELRSRSVRPGRAAWSIALAVLGLILTHSPVFVVVASAVGIAALALYWLRRTPAENRWLLQLSLLGAAVLTALVVFVARAGIISQLNAGSEFETRSSLWREMWRLVDLHPLEGWGWTGIWPEKISPYGWLDFVTNSQHASALNAFLDVYFQVGLVGFLSFVTLVILAFVRSWLLASNKRPVVYVWSPLVLVVLLVTSAAESTVLVEYGWVLLLICSVKAAQGQSWRRLLGPSLRNSLDG
ncbi:O-antigen ligase family protein [Cryobacterium arcticum]|uniref:Exopolysaccharide production protein n=1 Tax=Cryobacterium arcticum TaxID=670052 RepID=A0A1B1BGC8_9MICO|nr:O-antigen ligase family protein [Cryobacterium arcticum]ANP71607.1 exopolysaccharide production protein [Cryobacterium arcticum]